METCTAKTKTKPFARCRRYPVKGETLCSAHLKLKQRELPEEDAREDSKPAYPLLEEKKDDVLEDSELEHPHNEENKDGPPEDAERFENLKISQIVCNLTQNFNVAKVTQCTEIGHQMASNFVRVAASSIFANPFQAIMELISNAIDASTKRSSIGRFGMGFFSAFGLLTSGHYRILRVVTTTGRNQDFFALKVVFDGRELVADLQKLERNFDVGTQVALFTTKPLSVEAQRQIYQMISKFKFVTGVNIDLNNTNLNEHALGNKEISITVTDTLFQIFDHGSGMNSTVLKTLLIPSVSTKGVKPQYTYEPVACEVASSATPSLVLCANEVEITRVSLPKRSHVGKMEMVVFLPVDTKVPVARNNVLLADPDTFQFMVYGFKCLLDIHMAQKNVIDFCLLVRLFARESMQAEAYQLVEMIDEYLLSSGSVLVPNNQVLTQLCTRLKIDFIVSELFSITALEKAILSKVAKPNLNLFKFRKTITLDLPDPVLTMPFLPSLVFIREDTTQEQMDAHCDDKTNGCMTRNDYDTLSKVGLISPMDETVILDFAEPGVFPHVQKRAQILLDQNSSHLELIHTAQLLWKNRLVNLGIEEDYFTLYIMLWLRVGMDIDSFDDVLSTLISKLSSAVVKWEYTDSKITLLAQRFRNWPINVERVPRHTWKRETDVLFNVHPLPEMELKLLRTKVEFFPENLSQVGFFPSFFNFMYNVWDLKFMAPNSFASIADHLLYQGLPVGTMYSMLDELHKNETHVVESFIVFNIFLGYYYSRTDQDETAIAAVKQIRAELRRNVSLDVLLKLFKDMCSGTLDSGAHVDATVFQPLVNVFDIIERSVSATAAIWRMTSNFNTWDLSGRAIAEYKFTINDLIMFAYTPPEDPLLPRFTSSKDFMKREILKQLVVFAATNGGKCSIQALAIAVNYGTSKNLIISILAELFQNSLDALKANPELKPQKIEVGVNQKELHWVDYVGIDNVMSLLVPFLSTKINQESASGQMGTGFFNLFRQPLCDEVKIITMLEGNQYLLELRPLVDDGVVTNIQVYLTIFPGVEKRGTEVCIYFREGVDGVDGVEVACQVHLEMLSKYIASPVPLFLNGQLINQESSALCSSKLSSFVCLGYANSERIFPSFITVGDIPFGRLEDYWQQLGMDSSDKNLDKNSFLDRDLHALQPSFKTNVVFKLPKEHFIPVQSRDQLICRFPVGYQRVIRESQVRWLLMQYADGKLPDFIPHTSVTAKLSQLKFFKESSNEHAMEPDWVPTTYGEFAQLLHWVIDEVLAKNGSEPQNVQAEKIIDGLLVDELCKRALRMWFQTKTRTEDANAEDDTGTPRWFSVDVVLSNKYTNEPVLLAFATAFMEMYNNARTADVPPMILKEHIPGQQEVVASNLRLPKIGVVADGIVMRSNNDGMYMSGVDFMLLSNRHRDMANNFIKKAAGLKNDKKTFKTLFRDAVQEYFFNGPCTIVHELVHAVLAGKHSVFHPELSLTWKGKTTVGPYNAIVVDLQNKLLGAGFCTAFLEQLKKEKLM